MYRTDNVQKMYQLIFSNNDYIPQKPDNRQ